MDLSVLVFSNFNSCCLAEQRKCGVRKIKKVFVKDEEAKIFQKGLCVFQIVKYEVLLNP